MIKLESETGDDPVAGNDSPARRARDEAAATAIDAAAEEHHWSKNYAGRKYIKQNLDYEHYRPAYRYGWESRATYVDKSWDDVSDVLREDWSADPANFEMPWEDAEPAARDAWERISTAYPDHFKVR